MGEGAIATASRDKTVQVWTRKKGSPNEYESRTIYQANKYVNSIAFLPKTSSHDAFILSGGEDTVIDVRPENATLGDNTGRRLTGHSRNVCALSVFPSGSRFLSGGWDQNAIVWSATSWEKEIFLEGHENNVWALLALDDTTVITAGADRKVRKFDLRKAMALGVHPDWEVELPDIVRALCKLPDEHPSGAEFASGGNDGRITLWKCDGSAGKQVVTFGNHDSFIYSLAALPDGKIVSCGEDRTVRIWMDTKQIQVITIPAISIWSVSCCQVSGDIVAGSNDGVARVFTRNPQRFAAVDQIEAFKDAVKGSAVPKETSSGSINLKNMQDPAWLTTNRGREGQLQAIKELDGTNGVYVWNSSKYHEPRWRRW